MSEIKKIIEEHNLEKTIAEMYNSLIYDRSKQPVLYMMRYLISNLSEEERLNSGIELTTDFVVPESVPIVKFPVLDSKGKVVKHLTKTVWNGMKYIKTKYNNNISDLFSIENHEVYVPDPDAYTKYASFLSVYADDMNNKKNNSPMLYSIEDGFSKEILKISSSFKKETEDAFNHIKFESSNEICISRNIKDTPFVEFCSKSQISEISERLSVILNAYGFNETSNERLSKIKKTEFSVCYQNKEDHNLFAITNNINHLEIYCINTSKDFSLISLIKKSQETIDSLSKELEFEHHKNLGYLGPLVSSLAYGLKITTVVNNIKVNDEMKLKVKQLQEALNIIDIELENDIKLSMTSKLGCSLESQLFYFTNLLFLLLNQDKQVNKLEEGQLSKYNNLSYYSNIKSTYESSYSSFDHFSLINDNNITTFTQKLLESKGKVNELSDFKFYYTFFIHFFESLIENPNDLQKNYFYNYNTEKFDHLPNLSNQEIVKSIVVDFNLEIQRLVKGNISKDFISNNIKSISDIDENDTKAKEIIESIVFEHEELHNNSVSSEVNKLSFKINNVFTLKESLIAVYNRTKIIFSAIDSDFISDNLLGYLTNDILSIGSGVKINIKVRTEKVDVIEKHRLALGYVYSLEGDVYNVEFITFGKFICKLAANVVLLLNELSL